MVGMLAVSWFLISGSCTAAAVYAVVVLWPIITAYLRFGSGSRGCGEVFFWSGTLGDVMSLNQFNFKF